MTEDIDYKALFEQVQSENENIRIKYFKLKNDEMSFAERIKEKFSDFIEDDNFPMYFNMAMMLIAFIVAPIVSALFNYFTRKGNTNVE